MPARILFRRSESKKSEEVFVSKARRSHSNEPTHYKFESPDSQISTKISQNPTKISRSRSPSPSPKPIYQTPPEIDFQNGSKILIDPQSIEFHDHYTLVERRPIAFYRTILTCRCGALGYNAALEPWNPSMDYAALKEPMEVIHHHPVFVRDTSKYWYKPGMTREETINLLREKPPGTFIIRDSNSFPGAFGLALKVATPPPGVTTRGGDDSELVRHFLIEPTANGVKLKGCSNEPVFGTLSALVYQHSITPLALPCRLILPEFDPASTSEQSNSAAALLEQGAACNVMYLISCDTESLTGPEAVRRATAAAFAQRNPAASVHFKVSAQGITLTDNSRRLFFRRHYPVHSVNFCGLDPEDRRWTQAPADCSTAPVAARIFGFVAKKVGSRTDNSCHVFAELEPEQPATAVVNFITKVMMQSIVRR